MPYSPPELLIGDSKMDEKYDMWGLGVIILELFCKQNLIFDKKGIRDKKSQLKYLLTKFNINEPISKIEDKIKNNQEIKLEIDKTFLETIEDKDAIILIKNLLNFNKKKRPSSKEVLNSDYLKEYKDIDLLDIKLFSIPNDYEKNFKNEITNEEFIKIIMDSISKWNE